MFIDSLESRKSLIYRRYKINHYKNKATEGKKKNDREKGQWVSPEMAHFTIFNTVIVTQKGLRRVHTWGQRLPITCGTAPARVRRTSFFSVSSPCPPFFIEPTFLLNSLPKLRSYTVAVTVSDRVRIRS